MKKIISLLILLAGLIFTLGPSVAMAAGSNDQIFAQCKSNPSSPICKDQNTTTDPVGRIIKDATDIVAILTGIAAVIIIIVGGLTMVTSGGNSEAVAGARKRIVAAVIGLVIVALAWTIINFLTDKLIKT